MPFLGEASAVNVEATGGRAHYIDGESEPYNGGTRHARCGVEFKIKRTGFRPETNEVKRTNRREQTDEKQTSDCSAGVWFVGA